MVRIFVLVCGIVATLALVPVLVVTIALLASAYYAWAVGCLVLLIGSAVVIEITWHSSNGFEMTSTNAAQTLHAPTTLFLAVLLPVGTITLFGGVMDGYVSFRASCLAYLVYVAPAILLLIKRARKLTPGDWLFLRWAWLPIMVSFAPLLIRLYHASRLN
ncbi:MAG TPA: hypothetical protein VFA18_14070 [Gemmataceae bacterium]|nr:hypothetical protein [Gemmataceae bacterium]